MAQHIYGPVPSRRLGRSLGVDLVPSKTCSFNCIYCQLGSTGEPTLERAPYVGPEEIAAEMEDALSGSPRPDYITLSGSGEPTLNSSLGRIVSRIKDVTDVPVALLTNGSLFHLPEVRQACRELDVILPSLDAGDESLFRYVNRPHPQLTLKRVVDGLAALRDEFGGPIWLEVFILLGVNSFDAQVRDIRQQIEKIRPDRIQLNTAVRPSAEEFAYPVARRRLEEIRDLLGPRCEIIAKVGPEETDEPRATDETEVLRLLQRRPCTILDVARGLSIAPDEAGSCVRTLVHAGRVESRREGPNVYYRAVKPPGAHADPSASQAEGQ